LNIVPGRCKNAAFVDAEEAMRLIIGMSGASGVIYGVRLLQALREQPGVETHLVATDAARLNISLETDLGFDEVKALADHCHSNKDISANIASGSFRTDGMIVAPCSSRALSAIAHGHSASLLSRAADVTLKECRRLVLVPRETPLHAGHCEIMLKAARNGAVLVPPMPAHYIRPQSVDELVDHHVGRILDLFGIDAQLVKRWKARQG